MTRRFSSGRATAPSYIVTALLFIFSAGAIIYDAYRQAVPPLKALRVIGRADVKEAYTGENFGIPGLRDEYVALDLRDETTVRYRDWHPHYAEVKETLLSSRPIRVWIAQDDHYKSIYQVESAGRIVVRYDSVSSRMQRNSVLIVLMALVMALLVVPYCLWKAWQIAKKPSCS